MSNPEPLPLEQAKINNQCRICHHKIEASCQPVGWQDRFSELLYPVHLILNGGEEFAHASCLPSQPPKTKTRRTSLQFWTHGDRVGHTGDCHFWGSKICDCGLLTHLRQSHEEQEQYPKYQQEMSQHETRVESLRFSQDFIARFEQLVRQQAVHYAEHPCDECGQIILDLVINDRLDEDHSQGPQFISDLLGGGCKTFCKNCG